MSPQAIRAVCVDVYYGHWRAFARVYMATEEIMPDIYDLSMTDIAGNAVELSRFRNQVLLIVNLASQ